MRKSLGRDRGAGGPRRRLRVERLAAVGGDDDRPDAPTPTPTARRPTRPSRFEKGHSRAVRQYYGGGERPSRRGGDVEAEYHQPPRPATGGDRRHDHADRHEHRRAPRFDGDRPRRPRRAARPPGAGKRYVGVGLRWTAPGSPSTTARSSSARLRYDAGGAAEPVFGVKAGLLERLRRACVRIDVGGRGARLPALRAARVRRARGSSSSRSSRCPPRPAAAGGCDDVENSTCVWSNTGAIVL